MKVTLSWTLLLLSATAVAANPAVSPEFQHPLITQHGGIVLLPTAAQSPQANSKVVLDITSSTRPAEPKHYAK